jgi:hypothetical protein
LNLVHTKFLEKDKSIAPAGAHLAGPLERVACGPNSEQVKEVAPGHGGSEAGISLASW